MLVVVVVGCRQAKMFPADEFASSPYQRDCGAAHTTDPNQPHSIDIDGMVKEQCLVIAKIPVLKRAHRPNRKSVHFLAVPGWGTQFGSRLPPAQMSDRNVAWRVDVCTKLKVVLAGTPQSVWNSNISIRGEPSPKRFPS